nr:hypothetical protein [Bacillus sp. FJAT-47783]
MSKRRRTSKVEKWIKKGRGTGIGADYKPWLKCTSKIKFFRSKKNCILG